MMFALAFFFSGGRFFLYRFFFISLFPNAFQSSFFFSLKHNARKRRPYNSNINPIWGLKGQRSNGRIGDLLFKLNIEAKHRTNRHSVRNKSLIFTFYLLKKKREIQTKNDDTIL